MDWLEEKAENFKKYLRDTTLAKAMTAYFLIAAAGVFSCTIFSRNLCQAWLTVMTEREPQPDMAVSLIRGYYYACPYIYMMTALYVTAGIFLKNKIIPAIKEAKTAADCILAGDLSYETAHRSRDEFGMLCEDMEKIRLHLLKEKQNEWEAGEEQRKINAAFAHDIRTPLTVIKGCAEFLKRYVPDGKVSEEMLLQKLDTILYQEERLLEFSKTMTRLQTMEKWEVNCIRIDKEELTNQLKAAAESMEEEGILVKITSIDKNPALKEIRADEKFIMEAVENLLNNALRYAKKETEIQMVYEENRLDIYVKDDGPGFSDRALREAARVYFCENDKEKAENKEHFGIGLSIAKLLCEKHGGSLSLVNGTEGGAIAAASFYVGMQ